MGQRVGSPRLFENPVLERLTHIHPMTPAITWIPIVLMLLGVAVLHDEIPLRNIVSIAVISILSWTLTEYCLHRWVFHFRASSPLGKRMMYLMHGVHHEAPDDPTRLLMPPLLSFTLALLFGGGFLLLLGREYGSLCFAFLVVGYLLYDYTYYATHHVKPRTRWGRWIKKSHMMHQYVSEEIRYGVSTPLWDFVFSTHEVRKNGNSSGA